MKSYKICLDIGHMGKTSSPLDRGVVYKGSREADYTLLYAIAARGYLETAGYIVYLLCHGDYIERQKYCTANAFDLHIQCHLNACNGNYSLVYCRENEKAKILAAIIADKFQDLPILESKFEVATEETNGYNCMISTIPSLLIEPLFLDNEKHYKEIVEGNACFLIGKLLAEGILEWIDKL